MSEIGKTFWMPAARTAWVQRLPAIGGMLLIVLAGNVARSAEGDAPRKPNVLIIVADDLGYGDPGFQGGRQIPTPHLDALAAAGVRFTNGYVTCPVCSPTRAGLVTGRYQQRFGHEFNTSGNGRREDYGLPTSETTIANILKSRGYATGIVGKWHLGLAEQFHPHRRGYDEFFGFLGAAHPYLLKDEGAKGRILRGHDEVDEPNYLTDAIGREASAFIERHHTEPFLLQVTFNAVHNPLQAPAKYLDRFPTIEDEDRRTYAAMLSALDDNVGQILSKIAEHKLDADTLVFFVSDNGGPEVTTSLNTPLSGQKNTLWEGGVRVPFLLRWTGHVPAGVTYAQPVISLDIAATAAAVADAKPNAERPLDGVNLLPFVTGQTENAPHQMLYWRYGAAWAVRSGDYKLLKLAGEPLKLFNLSDDVAEQHDLSADQSQRVAELEESFAAWNAQLVEPLWRPNSQTPENQQRRQQRRAAAAR